MLLSIFILCYNLVGETMKKKENIIIASIISIIVTSFSIPIKARSPLTGKIYYGREHVLTLIFRNDSKMCYDCINYNVQWLLLIIELIVVFLVAFMVLNMIQLE